MEITFLGNCKTDSNATKCMIPAYLIKLNGIMQKPADKRKLKPGNHATVIEYMVLKTAIEMVPVTTSKQAMQANKAPVKKKKQITELQTFVCVCGVRARVCVCV